MMIMMATNVMLMMVLREDDGDGSRELYKRETKMSEEESKKIKVSAWLKPKCDEVKLIDFGGATAQDEYHTAVINTR